jgi:hypothetical protein
MGLGRDTLIFLGLIGGNVRGNLGCTKPHPINANGGSKRRSAGAARTLGSRA